jgi:hypothetical protein
VDKVEVELARQPFLNDFKVEQPKETAAEAEAQCRAALCLEWEGGIVEAKLADAFAQLFKVRGVGGEQAAEYHWLHFLETGQRLSGGALGVGDGVADAGLCDFLDLGGDDADLARRDFGEDLELGPHAADAIDQMLGAGGHELDFLALFDDAVDHADQDDDAEIGVVPAVDEHGL